MESNVCLWTSRIVGGRVQGRQRTCDPGWLYALAAQFQKAFILVAWRSSAGTSFSGDYENGRGQPKPSSVGGFFGDSLPL